MNAPRPSAWPVATALLAAFVLAVLSFSVWQSRQAVATRLSLAEDELSLLRAELRSTQNQLEAERLLSAAQAEKWRAAEAELSRLRATPAAP